MDFESTLSVSVFLVPLFLILIIVIDSCENSIKTLVYFNLVPKLRIHIIARCSTGNLGNCRSTFKAPKWTFTSCPNHFLGTCMLQNSAFE